MDPLHYDFAVGQFLDIVLHGFEKGSVIGGRQQVLNFIILDFVKRADDFLISVLAIFVYLTEDILDCALHQSYILAWIGHRVSFASTCLSVGKQC